MIVVRLFGGLGNQMFQYACARRLAHARQTSLKLDLSAFGVHGKRPYALGALNISAEIATLDEIAIFRRAATMHRVWPRGLFNDRRYEIVKERSFGFDPGVLKLRGNVFLEGYWQSERYFADAADVIRSEFRLRGVLSEASASVACRISATDAVSIHVRRGDYVSDAEINRVHGICGLEYYERAVEEIARIEINPHFFVFSDDAAWVRQNLHLRFPMEVVDSRDVSKDPEDLYLMSLCRHNVIANSSFSWWAGWLNRNPSKRVIAPKKWFSAGLHDTRDLIPPTWVRI